MTPGSLVPRSLPAGSQVEGQSLREPITPSPHKLASLVALWMLVVSLAWPQSAQPPGIRSDDQKSSPPDATNSFNTIARYEGKIVRNIEFRGITGSNPEMLSKLLAQHPGEPLERNKLRGSLETLYATGRFATLQVEAENVRQNELTLVFVATENYFYGGINVEGTPKKTNPKAHQLVDASKLDLGYPFSQADVDRAVERMQKVLADNGYYRSAIRYELKPNQQTRQMEVDFHVVPGALAHVGQVTLEGDTGIPPDRVRSLTKLKAGAAVKQGNVARALDRLRKNYQKNNHLEAQVSLTGRQYQPDTNTVNYVFKVEEGPTVAITTEGAKISKGELKKLVPVYQENSVDDDLLNEGRRNLRDYLQIKGHFDATVEVERHPVPAQNHVNILYVIDEGDRHKLAAIKVEGNRYFDTETITERMAIQSSSLMLKNGRFSQRLLTGDVASIKYVYQSNGFLNVKVNSEVQDNYEGRQDQIAVVIKIEEGPQTLVQSLQILGNHTYPAGQLERLVASVPNQPYSDANVAADRDNVTLYYYNHGFPDVQFEAAAAPAPDQPQRMNVVYTITEGQQVFVDRVLVSGLEFTRPFVVDRQMRILDGDPLSQSRMVASQRRLYDLGLFNEVDMAVQNPEGKEPSKDVLFNLQEAKRWTFRYGGGIEFATGNIPTTSNPQGSTGVSPNGVLEITRLNMFGRDQVLTFRARVGLLTRRGLISYDAPRLFHRERWRLNVTAFYDNAADVNTFTSQRLSGTLSAEQKYSRTTTLRYRMSWQRVSIDPNSLVIDPTLVPLYSKPVRLAIPSFTYLHDTRDNPIDSHKGSYTLADLGLATSALGSEANFGKVLLQNSTYYTFKKRWVVARNTQIGILHAYGTNNFLTPPDRK